MSTAVKPSLSQVKPQAAASETTPGSPISTKTSRWIHHPVLDLIVGCGAWSLPLVLLSYWSGFSRAWQVAVIFHVLTLVTNNPHYLATIHRAYRTSEDFSKYKILTLHLTAALLLTAILAHWSQAVAAWLYTIYITWSPWHYAGQNFGLAMMFARRNEAHPSRTERNALFAGFMASYLMLFLSFHSVSAGSDSLLLSLGIPDRLVKFGNIYLLTIFVVAGAYALMKMGRRVGWRGILAPATLYATQFFWFALPQTWQMISASAKLPQAAYSTGVLAFMHSAQYLWITSYYARRESQTQPQAWRARAYFATLVIGGIALFVPAPWLVSRVLHYDFTRSFLIFAAVINIHHFILDGAIWKLRDNRIASLLLGVGEKAHAHIQHTGTAFVNFIKGSGLAARVLRTAVPALLLTMAGLDQARFFLASNENKPGNVRKAAALVPDDSSIWLRVAAAESDQNAQLDALRKAASAATRDAAIQNRLGEALLASGHFDEAREHYLRMVGRTPDAQACFNLGSLALQKKNEAEAIEYWQKAVALDAGHSMAHLQLAQIYDKQNAPEKAVEHYLQFLALQKGALGSQIAAPDSVITAALRLGQHYTQKRQPEAAQGFFHHAASLAEKTALRELQSMALIGKATALAQMGIAVEALSCYQQALTLDAALNDAESEGVHWFAFGQFLSQRGNNAELAYVCFLQAEQRSRDTGKPVDERISEARENAEKALGAEAGRIKAQLKAGVAAVLSLRF